MGELTVLSSHGVFRTSSRRFRRRTTTRKTEVIIEKPNDAIKHISAIQILESPPSPLPPPVYILPSTQKALVVTSKGTYKIDDLYPVPELLTPTEILIEPCAVGLNPIDWKSVAYNFCLPSFPWITGRELAGRVVKVHPSVSHLEVGDRVWTSTYYRDVRAGCFQQYVTVPQHTVLKIPEKVGFEKAACLGVPGLTAAMTLWKWLGIGWPSGSPGLNPGEASKTDDWLLIWGGSTVTGQFATQLALQCGWKVVTVNSSRTKPLSLSLGATHVVSRDGKSNQELVEEIREVTGGRITKAIDLVGPQTATLVLQCVSQDHPVDFAPLAMMANVQTVPENITVHTVEMKQFVLNEASRIYAETLNDIIAEGKLQFPDILVQDGGLESIVAGLGMLQKGDLGGKKIVVRY